MEALEMSLIQHIGEAGSGITVGSLLAAQNSLEQFTQIAFRLRDLMTTDGFMAHICGQASCQPLAKVYVFADRKRKATAVALTVLPLPKGFGVNAFE